MLILPSGRSVDLSTDRARYHALRNHGPGPDSPHRALYPLVDVVYRHRGADGEPLRGWTQNDYHFSRYTLESVPRARDWPQADKDALFHWVRREQQRRHIETARRRLSPDQPLLSVKLNSSPWHLYSLLQARLRALPLARASAAQWRGTVTNLQAGGVREEEIAWSGLRSFLSRQPADRLLEKAQVLAATDLRDIRLELSTELIWGTDGGLRFTEVAQHLPHQAVYRATLGLDAGCRCVLRYLDETCNYRVGVVKTLQAGHRMRLNRFWFALDPYGRPIPPEDGGSHFHDSSVAAMQAADAHARASLGLHTGSAFHTRYDHLTLYGGSEYREWLIILPRHQRIFFGAHYPDHNVLAHVRTTTRHDLAGKRLLLVEEVQSDWHQSGHRAGYDCQPWGCIADAPFKKEWPLLAMKLMLIRAAQNGYDALAWPGGEIQERRYHKPLVAIRRRYDQQIPQALNRLGRPFGCRVETARIATRDPWLGLERAGDKWRVADGAGKFRTRDRFRSRDQALEVLARHARAIDLEVPVLHIGEGLRRQIAGRGLPLFGEALE